MILFILFTLISIILESLLLKVISLLVRHLLKNHRVIYRQLKIQIGKGQWSLNLEL